MKRILSTFLAMLLFVLPVIGSAENFAVTDEALPKLAEGLAQLAESDNPQFTVSFSNGASMTAYAALGQQPDGSPAFALNFPGAELIVSELLTALTRWDGSFSASTPELLQLLASFAAMPELGEKDLDALKAFGYALLGRLSHQAVSFSLSGSMLNLHINVDALLQDIDSAMPELLRQHADALNPLVSSITGMLLPQRLTCTELAELWPLLELSTIRTGIEADVAVLQMGDSTNISASCMGHSLTVQLSPSYVSLSFLPAGAEQAYVLDGRDFLSVAEMLMSLPSVTETEDEENDDITILDVTVTRQAILNALARNSMTIEMLLYKYDPWLQLLSGRTVAVQTVTTDSTAAAPAATGYSQVLELDDLLQAAAQLPETVFSLHAVKNDDDRTITANGVLMSLDYTFDLTTGRYGNATTWHAAIQDHNRYRPLDIRLNGIADYRGNVTVSLSSNQAILGAYAMNLRVQESISSSGGYRLPGVQISLTTDTDAFHFLYKDVRDVPTSLDVRLGDFCLTFDHPYRAECMTAMLSCGSFLVNATISGDHLNISSEHFGLDCVLTTSGLMMTGYMAESYDLYTFTLLFDEENELFTLTLSLDGDPVHLAIQPDEMKLRIDAEEMVLRRTAPGTWQLRLDGQLLATLLTEYSAAANQVRFRLLPAQGTADDAVTLLFRFDADPIVLPADAQVLSAEAFLQLLLETFLPADALQ